MGLFERVRQLLGTEAEAAATRDADPDDLFGMSTAYITMEASLGFVPGGEAALCFANVESTRFNDVVADVRAILDADDGMGESDTGVVSEFREDEYGYQWVVVKSTDFEALLTNLHFAADTLVEGRFGSRLLAAVFGFEATDRASAATGQRAYWVYSFRRGAFYPFAPVSTDERDERVEFTLQSVLDGELTVESDRQYWYPLWPDEPNGHPWD